MTEGRVQRIDEEREVAYIVRRGRTYTAPLAEVERPARVPSARVEFRLVRKGGEESAAAVRLRVGTRTGGRQRRFGDLTGARRPGAKVATTASANYGVDAGSTPFEVVGAWLTALADLDLDGVAALYRPDAVLHSPAGEAIGHNHIRAALERSPLAGLDPDHAEIYGLGRYVRLDCRCEDGDHGTALVIDRGAIVEQWLDTEPADGSGPETAEPDIPLQLVVHGEVSAADRYYAEHRIRHLLDTIGHAVRFCRVKLTTVDNPTSERPAMAEAVLDLDRNMVRAHADEPTLAEAVDRVVDRLRARIGHGRSRRRTRDRGRAAPHPEEAPSWPPADIDRLPSGHVINRPERPEIVRHRSYSPDELTLEEAAWDLAMLDYEFLLFVETSTGDDALLARDGDGRFVLHLRHEPDELLAESLADVAGEVAVSAAPVPELDVSQAVELLEGSGRRFIFFVDRATGRANVVHRRLDGHYGLVLPVL